MRGIDPTNPESMQELLEGGLFDLPKSPEPGGRAAAARGHPRPGRGLGRRGRRPGHRRADARRRPSCRRPYAAAAPPAVRPSRPSPRWSASSCGRAGCATPPRCGARCAPGRAPRPATACGCTPTCCRPRPTSTTRSASARTPRAPEELSDEDFDAALRRPARRRRPRRRRPTTDGVTLHADALAVAARPGRRPSPAQAALRDRYVAHLRAHPDGMSRAATPTTSPRARWCSTPTCDRVLLTLHAKAGRWFQFGGHCEPGDPTLAGAALREAIEESGLAGLVARPGAGAARRARRTVLRPARRRSTTSTSGSSPSRRGRRRARGQRRVARRALVAGRRAARPSRPGRAGRARPRRALDLASVSRPSEPGGGSSWAAADQPSR